MALYGTVPPFKDPGIPIDERNGPMDVNGKISK
jgi:hypothetical protein